MVVNVYLEEKSGKQRAIDRPLSKPKQSPSSAEVVQMAPRANSLSPSQGRSCWEPTVESSLCLETHCPW